MTNVISAQKTEVGNISWVEFTPQYHSHLVKCAVALVPHPIQVVKKVMFVYILELLNREGHMAFFDLQKGGRKANKAQMEKKHCKNGYVLARVRQVPGPEIKEKKVRGKIKIQTRK